MQNATGAHRMPIIPTPVSMSLKLYVIVLIMSISTAIRSGQFLLVRDVEVQLLAAATERLIDAMEFTGDPLSESDIAKIRSAIQQNDSNLIVESIQERLDAYCVAGIRINDESRVTVEAGPTDKVLVPQGWCTFLVKVHNEAGITPQLRANSPNAGPQYRRSTAAKSPTLDISMADVANRWLDIAMVDGRPLNTRLSGLPLKYRIIQLYSRDTGAREASLAFDVGQGTQDIGFRNEIAILFDCAPATEVSLRVRDYNGEPISCSFVIKDDKGRVYPNPARRLAPDFFFHDQAYRADGETVMLPPLEFQITVSRGPEYHAQTKSLRIGKNDRQAEIAFDLVRWIHPASRNWYSEDNHVHAAGCTHHENPTEGVSPKDMMRHILGEDLNVGCVLTWGPC